MESGRCQSRDARRSLSIMMLVAHSLDGHVEETTIYFLFFFFFLGGFSRSKMLALLYSLSQGQALKLSGAPLYRLKSAGATAASTVVVGGFVTRSLSLSVRAPMYASRPKWLPGVLPLQPNPPTTTTIFFFFSILGSSILHTVARLCLSLSRPL